VRRAACSALVVLVVAAAGLVADARAAPRAVRPPAFYLAAAQLGLADVQAHWWDAKDGWYYDTYNRQPPSMPLARLWSAYPLFETLIAVATA
jgi:hypothetical protein